MSEATTSPIPRDRIEEAKARFTIPVLWRMLGLPGSPPAKDGVKFSSPFRPDKTPSCSLYDGGKLMTDWSLGKTYDGIAFVAEAKQLGNGEAFIDLLKMAGMSAAHVEEPIRVSEPARGRPDLSSLGLCSDADLERISALRSIPLKGLGLARERKLLFACQDPCGSRCWVITDDARRNAIKRRLDGEPFIDRDAQTGELSQKKSKCWKGSQAKWPIGIAQAGGLPAIALCEGGPDFLAAFYLAWAGGVERLLAPVCMGGAALSIHEDALGMFRGKRIRIFGHVDVPGQQAVRKWAAQLRSVQAEVDCFDFCGLVRSDGEPVTDLNDFLLADHKKSGCGIEITTGAFDFALERRAS
jgi:hypothetical protein